MKVLILFTFLVTISLYLNAQDILIKKNGMKLECKVLKTDSLNVYYYDNWLEKNKQINKNKVLKIIYNSSLAKVNDITEDTTIKLKAVKDTNSSFDNCLKGETDAKLFHGREFGNFITGFLFGGFGVLGAALSSPNPIYSTATIRYSKNKALFNDPSYQICYKKKARGMNVINSSIGWALWILILAIHH